MERIAAPLREMGASVVTDDGHAPIEISGGRLRGITQEMTTPSAQVKGALLLAGLDARGATTVREPAATRDHTERAVRALGGPVRVEGSSVTVERFQHQSFTGIVPGDPSSAAFLVAAAALTGSEVAIEGLGLNPTRLHFLEVMRRMGVRTERTIDREEVGEPVGDPVGRAVRGHTGGARDRRRAAPGHRRGAGAGRAGDPCRTETAGSWGRESFE